MARTKGSENKDSGERKRQILNGIWKAMRAATENRCLGVRWPSLVASGQPPWRITSGSETMWSKPFLLRSARKVSKR